MTYQEMAAEYNEEVIGAFNITFVTLCENDNIDEVTAFEHASLFAEWAPNISYKQKAIRKYEDKLYKCLQDHTSQDGWDPSQAPSLWKVVGDPTEEWPEWSQPVGAGDGYALGDKVSHNGKHWISNFNGENIWEPGIYGWNEVE